MSDDDLAAAVVTTSVYARVAPEHKLRIVRALQCDGSVVAMTGDGVNDAPALKSADIGVAMGQAGTEVSKEAADMILVDDNFATILAAVAEGRAIFESIRKFLRYLLSSNMGEVAAMFFGVVLASRLGLDDTGEVIAAPLLAVHILWINLLTDTAPALALGVDAPIGEVMDRPPRQLTDRVIDLEMQLGILFTGLVMGAATLVALDATLAGGWIEGDGDIVAARTVAFTTLVFAQLFNCFSSRSARHSAFADLFGNRLLWLAVAASVLLQWLVVHTSALNAAFSTTPLSPRQWLMCVALGSSVLVVDETKKLAVRHWAQRSPGSR
ncbi:MAG: HAD-IC family P-type ATPase [Acidimicrobiales bacterium]